MVGQFSMIEGSANRLESEQEREQEQEQEKEVEARRDQQIEVEKFVDREYSRQEEFQKPWQFSLLSKPFDSVAEHPFYFLKDFKLRHQEPFEFPDFLMLSSNYFNPKWNGLRRIKNVIMVLEYAPSTAPDRLRLRTTDELRVVLSEDQEQILRKVHTLLGFHASTSGNPNFMSIEDLQIAIQAAIDKPPSKELVESIMKSYGNTSSLMSYEGFRNLLTSGELYPQSTGRYYVAVSLAEAETLRRILHVRMTHANESKTSFTGEMALRFSPIASPGASSAGDGGIIFDSSKGWRAGTSSTTYESAVAHSCFRFFDGDMHYGIAALNILVRALHGSTRDREKFFQSTSGSRRRMERKWQDTPLAKVFRVSDEWIALKQRSQASYVRESLVSRKISFWEAFTAIDYDNNGVLSPAEFYGALIWLQVCDYRIIYDNELLNT